MGIGNRYRVRFPGPVADHNGLAPTLLYAGTDPEMDEESRVAAAVVGYLKDTKLATSKVLEAEVTLLPDGTGAGHLVQRGRRIGQFQLERMSDAEPAT